MLCCRLVSDKQKCIKTCYKIKNNNKSQVYYKLYTNVQNNDKKNKEQDNDEDDCDAEDAIVHDTNDNVNVWEEDNIHLYMSPKDINKKHLIVYYKPPRKLMHNCFMKNSYFLQNLAHNFMYLCFCRSYYHPHQNYHYTNRRLGTF